VCEEDALDPTEQYERDFQALARALQGPTDILWDTGVTPAPEHMGWARGRRMVCYLWRDGFLTCQVMPKDWFGAKTESDYYPTRGGGDE
ncbi:MAG: hypothetical protein ABH877_04580, partial [bacterium]